MCSGIIANIGHPDGVNAKTCIYTDEPFFKDVIYPSAIPIMCEGTNVLSEILFIGG